ncbi:hypothetical protein [Dysgonomonas macrotermitis]|uniref:Uncharacterized protein n=1 Tax=Dysgonomonas macrotermitis TaxID=1346286 RepID=A0A1M4ZCY8_9BACT|nr:hypothetical protein [Dysgonomonas macrotermitis]SHF15900.1 hypothetical protein SAMN05444362_10452 [Dysgonomonas macrotermitis]
MKKIFAAILLIPLLLTSCSSTYFFSVLNTGTPYTEKVDNGDFVFENDSLWIAHCFNGENAPIQITVYNKLDTPLYVDWGKSALIVQDQAVSYAGKASRISISTSSETYHYPFSSSSETQSISIGSIGATPSNVDFIPPRTKVSNATLSLNLSLKDVEKLSYKNAKMGNKHQESIDVKRANFTPEDTPFSFTSYITVYAVPEKPMVFEQDFYISSLIKTNAMSPKNLPGDMSQRGDMFFIEKPANNTGWAILLGATVVAGAAILETKAGNNYYYE